MKLTILLAVVLLALPGCRRGGGDNPGGYSQDYWKGRREMSDLAHRPRKGKSNMWGLALVGAMPGRRRVAS
jgi:hypothetical protein